MSTGKPILSTWVYVGTAWLVLSIMATLLFQIKDPFQIYLLLLFASLLMLGVLPFRRWTLIDQCLCLLTVYDVTSCLYATCLSPAMQRTFLSLFCLAAYFVLRRLFNCKRATQIFLQGSVLPVGVALLLSLCSFFIFRQAVLKVGFHDTYPFRYLFLPLGYVTNVWAEILLMLLGWLCIVRRYSSLFIFLTLLALFFSFSRGAYIALGVYVVSWLVFVKPAGDKLRMPAMCILALLLTGLCFPKEMKTTLQMSRTLSQRQSTEGRLTATEAAWDTFRQCPVLGYGSGNYTFAVDQILNQDSRRSYTSYAPNLVVLLLIEKGVVGMLLYLLLILSVSLTIQKRWRLPESRMIGCVLLALAVKEMTQATLLHTPFSLFIFYALLAFLQKKDVSEEEWEEQKTIGNYILPSAVIIAFLSWNFFHSLSARDESYQREAQAAWEKGDLAGAVDGMEHTGKVVPALINQGLLYRQCFQKTADRKYLQAAQDAFDKAYRKQPADIQIRYLQMQVYRDKGELENALRLGEELATNYPQNSLYLSAFFDILYQRGEKEKALDALVNAIRCTPRLLTGRRIRELQQTDPVFYHALKQQIATLKPAISDPPAEYARYGYIARWCGNRSDAEIYLRKAVNDLPNLATPWHLLGEDKKYRLLLYGAFHKNLLSAELPLEQEMSEERLFAKMYYPKFTTWYGRDLGFLP